MSITCKLKVILLAKTTVAQNEAALSHHTLRGQYFLAVVFVRSILSNMQAGHRSFYKQDKQNIKLAHHRNDVSITGG